MRLTGAWFTEPVQIATRTGEGAYGAVYADTVEVLANVDSRRVLSRNSAGDEVTAELTLRLPPNAEKTDGSGTVDSLELLAPESTVTVYGRESQVITTKPFTVRGRVVYVEATLT